MRCKIAASLFGACLAPSIAVHLLEVGRRIEYVADYLGQKNRQNTKIYARITNRLGEQGFGE